MKARILIVGEDPALLMTRSLLLKEWETATATSLQANIEVQANDFDLILICQSVTEENIKALIQSMPSSRWHPLILAIRYPGENTDLGVETHVNSPYESPGWLPDRVSEIMAERTVSC
jgi:hypothetical protein